MAYLRIYLDQALIDQYEITSRSVSIGRAPDNDIVLNNPGVSSHHARIEFKDGVYTLHDNDSTNGTFINAKRIKAPHVLVFHEEIQIYNFVLKFMPRPRLEKEKNLNIEPEIAVSETVEVNIPNARVLNKLRHQHGTPYLIQIKGQKEIARYRITDLIFTIGKSKESNIQISGWFAPKMAAQIQRERDDYYLIPYPRGKVKLNHIAIMDKRKIKAGDEIRIRGKDYVFQFQS